MLKIHRRGMVEGRNCVFTWSIGVLRGETALTTVFERAHELKQALVDFVYDAEGELAIAMEQSIADQLKTPIRDINQSDLAFDRFLTVSDAAIDQFIQETPDLSKADQAMLQGWKRTFIGLFAVSEVLPDGLRLVNWLTAKPYTVRWTDPKRQQDMARLQTRDIILSRIAPVTETEWMFSGPYVLKGRLGKPKLAVAIGTFKDDHWHCVYGDAPELLEEAWQSVERYHTVFVDYFGGDEITLSGYELSKRIGEFQAQVTQQHLEAAGIDSSKPLTELVEEAGMTAEDMDEIAETLGIKPDTLSKVLLNPSAAKMASPQVQLPPDIKKAEQVTVLAHPRWGQTLLTTYQKLQDLLAQPVEPDSSEAQTLQKLVLNYLKDDSVNAFVWRRLAKEHPKTLESALQMALERPDFQLKDLDALLQEFNKPLEPALPEIASVPLHLNELFQAALAEINKPKKSKKQSKSKGFI